MFLNGMQYLCSLDLEVNHDVGIKKVLPQLSWEVGEKMKLGHLNILCWTYACLF